MVYLDYAATAPLCEEAREAMLGFYSASGNESVSFRGNANSLHTPGRDAFAALENSRRAIAKALCVRTDEIVFTSGSTESIYLALFGLFHENKCTKIITSVIEHAAVKNAAKEIAGTENVVLLRPDKYGYISPEVLDEKLAALEGAGEKVLVSLQLANSELATVEPVKSFAEIAHRHGALIHCDATQALGKIPFSFKDLGVDAGSISSHKIGGPHGIGALYLKAGTKYRSAIAGGKQEGGRRGGTQNVAGAAGFAAAISAAVDNVAAEQSRLQGLKDMLRLIDSYVSPQNDTINNARHSDDSACHSERSEESFKHCHNIIDEAEARAAHPDIDFLPNVNMFIIDGLESEMAIMRFDELGFAVSGGSACSSHSTKASETLTSIGLSDKQAFCALRVSFGRYTTTEDIEKFLEALKRVISWER